MKWPLFKYFLIAVDLFIIIVAIQMSGVLFGEFLLGFLEIWQFVILFYSVILVVFHCFDLYRISIILSPVDHMIKILQALFSFIILFVFFAFLVESNILLDIRFTVLSFFTILFLVFLVVRVFLFLYVFKWVTRKKIYYERAIIVGGGNTARLIAANLDFDPSYGLSIEGFIDNDIEIGTVLFRSKKVLGKITDLEKVVHKNDIKEIIVCAEKTGIENLMEVLDKCNCTKARVKVASPLYGVVARKLSAENYGEIPVIEIGSAGGGLVYRIVKRIFDIMLATIGLIFLSPIMLAIVLAIYMDSGRPIIFTQVRIGKNGKPFKFYKFRSMRVGSQEDTDRKLKMQEFIKQGRVVNGNRKTKIVDESKITRIGSLIRKTSIDELPQLINVIKGEMSLVGPRPCLPYEWEHYDDWHKRRLSAMPGCTGVWQVSGRSEVTFEDMVVLDLYYIQNQSILLDIKIMLKTIPVMILGRGGL